MKTLAAMHAESTCPGLPNAVDMIKFSVLWAFAELVEQGGSVKQLPPLLPFLEALRTNTDGLRFAM